VKVTEESFYSAELANVVKALYQQIDLLNEELQDSGYSEFSVNVRDELNKIFETMGSRSIDTPIEKLEAKWHRLLHRKEIEERAGNLVGLKPRAGESFSKEMSKIKKSLQEENIGKGFWEGNIKTILDKQDISYNTLLSSFESIRINKFHV
jgi:hypothetical protein